MHLFFFAIAFPCSVFRRSAWALLLGLYGRYFYIVIWIYIQYRTQNLHGSPERGTAVHFAIKKNRTNIQIQVLKSSFKFVQLQASIKVQVVLRYCIAPRLVVCDAMCHVWSVRVAVCPVCVERGLTHTTEHSPHMTQLTSTP